MTPYLASSSSIDWTTPAVHALAQQLAAEAGSGDEAIARRCFEFVRDEIRHSWDYRSGPMTLRASEVLAHRTGYCYAKSHLLAALLRANGIPAALCYQRLPVDDSGAPYCLHGLNAVYLADHGWYRIDARGNKPGVDARFTPPHEHLAFPIRGGAEQDIEGLYAEPLQAVVDALTRHSTIEQVFLNLPDIEAPLRTAGAPT
ncbi:transglutaminase family protein [Niveibacterium sp. COAC-50]|uniref:transglutaminase-like domain-containing protein n=1 Tax=Niveibacterium sp. COAC-50 TaxID=2729384 RepID=UPI001551E538|nr:transglutaminase family protein [Niveibacterium sp. COAC-50]